MAKVPTLPSNHDFTVKFHYWMQFFNAAQTILTLLYTKILIEYGFDGLMSLYLNFFGLVYAPASVDLLRESLDALGSDRSMTRPFS